MTTVVETYKLVFRGELLDGVTVDEARANAARLLKLTDAQVERVFSGRSVTLKKGLAQPDITRYRTILARAGLVVHAEIEQAETAFPTLLMDVEPPKAETIRVAPPPPPRAEPAPAPVLVATPAALADLPPLLSLDMPLTPPAPPSATSRLTSLSLAPIEQPAAVEVDSAKPTTVAAAPLLAEDEIVCPKCDLRQLKRTICRRCDTDMPAHASARASTISAAASGRGIPKSPTQYLAERTLDIEESSGIPPLWSTSLQGRIGRLRFLVWGLPVNVVAMAFAYLLPIVVSHHGRDLKSIMSAFLPMGMALFASRFVNARMEESGVGGVPVFFPVAFASGFFLALLLAIAEQPGLGPVSAIFLFGLAGALYMGRLMALRLHDIGGSGWLALLMLAPGVNIVLWLVLLFWPGSINDNRHGEAPHENTLGVYLGLLLIPVLLIARFTLV